MLVAHACGNCSSPHGLIKSTFPAYCAVNANHLYKCDIIYLPLDSHYLL